MPVYHSVELNAQSWTDVSEFFADMRKVLSPDWEACHVRVIGPRGDVRTGLKLIEQQLARGKGQMSTRNGKPIAITLKVVDH